MVAYLFRKELFALMARPLIAAWQEAQQEVSIGRPELVFTSPVEAFMVLFKLALLAGVFIASPFVFREIWRFISPGLYDRERKWGIAFVLVSVVLFVGGATFAYSYVLPASYKYFLSYAADSMGMIKDVMGKAVDVKLSLPFDIKPMITMDEYFGLTSTLLLVFGAVFELPLLLAILAILGIVSAKQLWSFNRYAVVLFAVLGAVLTPGDMVVGQLAMTGTLTVLYNLSILVAWIVGKKRQERVDAEERALVQSDS
jgi:sec-independent protein translocase protein TatC